jgi:hypothetical protein
MSRRWRNRQTSVEDKRGAKGGVFRRQHHIGRLGFGRNLFDVGSRPAPRRLVKMKMWTLRKVRYLTQPARS